MLNQILAWAGSFIIGIGAVWAIINKWSPKIRRGIKISNEIIDILDSILDAWEDKNISKQEIELIRKEANDLKEVLK